MTEDEFLERWYAERPAIEAWGKFVANTLLDHLAPLVSPVKTDIFVRIPAVPRVKQDGSLVTKAFYRGKDYKNPLGDITDKVGVRFVVLLPRDISIVCKAIEAASEWEASKDRDYEAEREKAPYEFRYQSDHYVVRCRGERRVGRVLISVGTPCEVQVRTLLQHAHSELTHDTVYKPSVVQTPEMHRAAAKAMALVEATTDYFDELTDLIEKGVQPNKSLSKELAELYKEIVGLDPEPTRAEGLLNDAFSAFGGADPVASVKGFFKDRGYLLKNIAERAPAKLLFRQPSILLAYFAAGTRTKDALERWPLTRTELKPVLTDQGIAAPSD